jgi:hypothetical protein
VTTNAVHRSREMSPATRATSARSDQVKRAQPTWRRRTAAWWRSTRISASLGEGVPPRQPRESEGAMGQAVEEGEHNGVAASPTPSWLVKAVVGSFWTPNVPGQSGTGPARASRTGDPGPRSSPSDILRV